MPILDTFDSGLVYGLQNIHVHGILARNITGSAHLAVIYNFENLVGILKLPVCQLLSKSQSADTCVGIEVIPGDTGADIGMLVFLYLLKRYIFAA
jgi:hypothetical protein